MEQTSLNETSLSNPFLQGSRIYVKEKAKGLRELEAEDASKEAMPFSGEGLMRIKAHKDDAQVKFKPNIIPALRRGSRHKSHP